MRTVARACLLALRDYAHEGLLSTCSVLGLAAVLTPLLVLYGVKFGVSRPLRTACWRIRARWKSRQ